MRDLTYLLIGLVALLSSAAPAAAEIAPKYYAQMQRSAPEALRLEILASETSTCWFWLCDGRDVVVRARVVFATRTATDLKPGDRIELRYWHDERDGISGPRPIRILRAGTTTDAFIAAKGEHYEPAARGASFEPLIPLDEDRARP